MNRIVMMNSVRKLSACRISSQALAEAYVWCSCGVLGCALVRLQQIAPKILTAAAGRRDAECKNGGKFALHSEIQSVSVEDETHWNKYSSPSSPRRPLIEFDGLLNIHRYTAANSVESCFSIFHAFQQKEINDETICFRKMFSIHLKFARNIGFGLNPTKIELFHLVWVERKMQKIRMNDFIWDPFSDSASAGMLCNLAERTESLNWIYIDGKAKEKWRNCRMGTRHEYTKRKLKFYSRNIWTVKCILIALCSQFSFSCCSCCSSISFCCAFICGCYRKVFIISRNSILNVFFSLAANTFVRTGTEQL